MSKCCGRCFDDPFLSQEIERLTEIVGNCDFCNSTNEKLIEASQLVDYFEKPLSVYKESADINSYSFEALLRTDWALFGSLDTKKAETLLCRIFEDDSFVQRKYLPVEEGDTSAVETWEDFREELKHRNRFFPKKFYPTEKTRELFGLLTAPLANIPHKVYRARICEKEDLYLIEEMVKPPVEKSGNGRANPIGIPCLYAASDAFTAIAEVRPHKGELVCVAEFEILEVEDVTFADLRNPLRKFISPFLADEEQVKLLYQNMGLLCRLGEELTLPVLPREAHLEYLPSQYLCEFIKDCGFTGLIYSSALGTGVNYAIFDDTAIVGKNVRQFVINSVDVTATSLDGH